MRCELVECWTPSNCDHLDGRSVQHVKLWIQWAVRQFNLTGIKLSDWNMSGEELCALNNEDFK